jgi:hypothetical protein
VVAICKRSAAVTGSVLETTTGNIFWKTGNLIKNMNFHLTNLRAL